MKGITHNLTPRNLVVLVFGLTLGILVSLGQGVFAERSEDRNLPLDELRTFSEVFAKIKQDYVEPVEDKTLLENAIKGMLSGLDPHSSYLIPEDYEELQAGTSGEFGGLGIEVGMENGFVKVIAPIDDTPAQRAGVEAGDLVIRLDDTPVKGMTLSEAVRIMRGAPGTNITLTIIRDSVEKPLKLTITRDVIKVVSVKSRMLDRGYGYVRITQFQSHTGENLRDAMTALKKENGGSLKGMVLDLRNNPGGVLSAAVAVADAFLKKGIIVYTEGRMDDAKLTFNAKPTDILDGAALVVLVNGGSASASEIVAGALKDHKRGIVMGSKTFGKGSVQTILPMENGSALKLTTARYYTPKGLSIQAKGIEPDIVLDNVKVANVETTDLDGLQEADLARHLQEELLDDEVPADSLGKIKAGKPANKKDSKNGELATEDFTLYQALNLLKGITILQNARS
ncbi:MAG: S41 family peptidase [Gammaproteobacteria bacterium]